MRGVGDLIFSELFLDDFKSIHPKRVDPNPVYGRFVGSTLAATHIKEAFGDYDHFYTGFCLYNLCLTGGILCTAAAREYRQYQQ
jgi:hypothetical protein